MLKLYDYLPSQNAWKVRLLLSHLGIEYETVNVSIFEGEGQQDEFLDMNPIGAVPVLELEDGRSLSESNAILCYLAAGSRYFPADAWQSAQVVRWLNFEADYIQNSLASYRHLLLTGKASEDEPRMQQAAAASRRVLGVLARWLTGREYLAGHNLVGDYSIADMSLCAYVSRAGEVGMPLEQWPSLAAWWQRIQAQPGFLATVYAYDTDPHSGKQLPR